MSKQQQLVLAALAMGVLWAPGCSCRPSPPAAPPLRSGQVGRAAMTEYDANQDGRLDTSELARCPGLVSALPLADADEDGTLTAAEISARADQWFDAKCTVVNQSVTVLIDGRPLGGATVTFEPEKFMGDGYKPTSAVTDEMGVCSPAGQDAQYPGLYLGIYRVRISKQVGGQESVPARYNTQSQLGREIAPETPNTENLLVFKLDGK